MLLCLQTPTGTVISLLPGESVFMEMVALVSDIQLLTRFITTATPIIPDGTILIPDLPITGVTILITIAAGTPHQL